MGRYQLDLAIESDCEALPPDERNRRYTADIEAESIAGYDYVVRLYDAWFYVALACHEPRFPAAADICNQFRATRDGDSLHFDFMPGPDDNWSGNTLFEWIPGDLWLEMRGMASGRVETTTVAAAGTIYVTRWTGGLGGTPGATYTFCSAATAQLIFIKQ